MDLTDGLRHAWNVLYQKTE